MKLEISKTGLPILTVCQSFSFVSCRISGRVFYEAGTPKDHLTFRQVQQSVGPTSPVHTAYHQTVKARAVFAQMANKLHEEPL